MSVNGDVSEQVVRLSLEGFEILARLTGSGAKNVAAMIYTIMKDKKQTKGKIRLNNMLKTGKPLKIFTVSREDLKTFEELSNYQDDVNFKIKEILDQRERLWAKRKLSKDGNEMHEYAEQISSLNDKLVKLRKRVELCEDIKTRVPKIDNNLSELDTQEEMEKETKERKKEKRKKGKE